MKETTGKEEVLFKKMADMYDAIAGGDEETEEFEFLCDELDYIENVLKEGEIK